MFPEESEAISFDDALHAFETGFLLDGEINVLEARHPIVVQSRDKASPWYEKTVRHAGMVDRFAKGKYRAAMFPAYRETISSSDFTQLTANLLYWRLLPLYAQEDNQWEKLVSINDTIQDFRAIQYTRIEGGDGPFGKVRELADYPMVTMTASDKSYKLAKYGEVVSLSWESTLNDYLGMFKNWPKWLAIGARATENQFVTGLMAAATGPSPALFSTNGSTNGGVTNQVGSAPLTEANLIAAYVAMTNQKAASGNPLMVTPRYLVVPPALFYTAQKLLNAGTLLPSVIATSGTQNLISGYNAIPGLNLELVVSRWLPTVDVSANKDNTWYLVAEPGTAAAIEVGFLAGHRQPQVFRKMTDQENAAGGQADFAEGDFEHDAMAWKIRHVLGGIALEPRYAYANVGA